MDIDEQAIVDKLMAANEQSASSDSTSDTDKQEAQPKETSDTVSEQPKEDAPSSAAGSDTQDQDPKDGSPVAYKRFKQVWGRAKELERKTSTLEAELAELRQARQAATSAGEQSTKPKDKIDELIDEVLGQQQEEDPVAQVRNEVFELRKERHKERIDADLDYCKTHYPDVPARYLLQAAVDNPKVNIREEAQRIAAALSAYEVQVLAKHAKEQGSQPVSPRKPPTAPPDLSHRSGASSDRSTQVRKYKDYDDLEANVLKQLGF